MMMARMGALAVAAGLLAGCQSIPQNAVIDQECATKKIGTKILSKVASFAAGPAGGIVGHGVSLATDPGCALLKAPEQAAKADKLPGAKR
jgi:hypothetical protein